jgi:hypothetical protein
MSCTNNSLRKHKKVVKDNQKTNVQQKLVLRISAFSYFYNFGTLGKHKKCKNKIRIYSRKYKSIMIIKVMLQTFRKRYVCVCLPINDHLTQFAQNSVKTHVCTLQMCEL